MLRCCRLRSVCERLLCRYSVEKVSWQYCRPDFCSYFFPFDLSSREKRTVLFDCESMTHCLSHVCCAVGAFKTSELLLVDFFNRIDRKRSFIEVNLTDACVKTGNCQVRSRSLQMNTSAIATAAARFWHAPCRRQGFGLLQYRLHRYVLEIRRVAVLTENALN